MPSLQLVIESLPPIWSDEQYRTHIQYLNFQQFELFQIVLDWCTDYTQFKSHYHKKDPLYMFTSGGAGTGKSHVIKVLYQMVHCTLRQEGEAPDYPKILLLAPTGVAAFNKDGLTIHAGLLLLI